MKKMNAKEFRLKNGKYEPRFTTEKKYIMYGEDEVDRLMEEYHQSKVDNVVLDDVMFEPCHFFSECKNKLKDQHCDEHMVGSMHCFKG